MFKIIIYSAIIGQKYLDSTLKMEHILFSIFQEKQWWIVV